MSPGVLGDRATISPAALSPRRRPPPFPLREPGSILSSRGRHSLYLGLKALGIGAGDELLVPAYHHGSEVEAVLATGADCRFYGGRPDLAPDPDQLEALLGPRVRGLHLTHFIGFGQDSERWRQWCSERGLLLIEDAAQSWLASGPEGPLGSLGDLAIFCLYKSVGVPDGAALVCRAALQVEQNPSASGLVGATKPAILWAAQRRLVPARIALRRPPPDAANFDVAAEFSLGDAISRPSLATLRLLPHFDYERARSRRRRNYLRLLEALGERVPKPFAQLPPGASPFLFPVQVEDKAGCLAHLRAARVKGVDFWAVPHPALDADRFPDLVERRATTVGLPAHQELSVADVDQIARAGASWRD